MVVAQTKRFLHIALIFFTILFGTLGILSFWTDKIDPTEYPIVYFLGLAVPLIIICNFVLLIIWAIRRKRWAFLPLAAILVNIMYIGLVYRLRSYPMTEAKHSFSLFTYNVGDIEGAIRPYHFSELAKIVAKEKADILCFQELKIDTSFTEAQFRSIFKEWKYIAIPLSKHQEIMQVALLSKYPIEQTKLITYPQVKNCSMWSDILLPEGKIRVINNHLQTTAVSGNRYLINLSEDQPMEKHDKFFTYLRMVLEMEENVLLRAQQAKNIRQLIDTTRVPMIVCGDFNSIPSSFSYNVIKGDNLYDGFRMAGHGYMSTYKYFNRLLRIDYILYSDPFKGQSYTSPHLEFSDHYPVMMKLGYDFLPK